MKTAIAALFAAFMVLAIGASAQATQDEAYCEPETIEVETTVEVEVGTEYQWELVGRLTGHVYDTAWSEDQPGDNTLTKKWVKTDESRPILEEQTVTETVPNPDYDPECGVEPDPEYVTVAWLLPIDFDEWDGLGQPSGGPGDNGIWPQSYVDHANTGTGVDLDALDGMSMSDCAVYQIDTYPEAAGLHELGTLDWGDDHEDVISWKFLYNEDCSEPEPDPTPTPEPEDEPDRDRPMRLDVCIDGEVTRIDADEFDGQPRPVDGECEQEQEAPEPQPEPVEPDPEFLLNICYEGTYYPMANVYGVDPDSYTVGECPVAEGEVSEDPPFVAPTTAPPSPASAGHGVMGVSTSGNALSVLLLGLGTLGVIGGARLATR